MRQHQRWEHQHVIIFFGCNIIKILPRLWNVLLNKIIQYQWLTVYAHRPLYRNTVWQGDESVIFRLWAHDEGSRSPYVPHCSTHLLVRFVAVSNDGLTVNILKVTACNRKVAKSTVPFQIAAVNDGVELEVGILVRIVVAKQTNQELLTGLLLRYTGVKGWWCDGLVGLLWKRVR